MQITLQEKAHPGFCSPVSVERNSPVFQTLPYNASTDKVSLLIFKAWTKKSLHSITLTVLKVVEERHIPSTKSIRLWRSSGGHREASIKRWQVCKANFGSVRRSKRCEKTSDSDSTSETLKSEHHTTVSLTYSCSAANMCTACIPTCIYLTATWRCGVTECVFRDNKAKAWNEQVR